MAINQGCEKCPYGRMRSLNRELEGLLETLIPGQAGQHLKNARREMLLAVKGLTDYLLEESEKPSGSQKPKNIPLD